QEETTAKVVAEVEALGRKALPVPGDISQIGTITQLIEKTLETFGRIDILVNNVGGGAPHPGESDGTLLGQLELEWDNMYQQNLKAPVILCQAVAPHLIKQNSGKIVTIASVAGRNTCTSKTSPIHYRAMKAGLIRYAQSLADELGPHNINVNTVCPGYVYSSTWERGARRMVETREEYRALDPREWFIRLNQGKFPELSIPTPLMREQTVEDIGQAVLFLVSEAGKNITGQSLNVDGGRHKN
ncbi:MAG: SDR family oxidoreductase, partial [Deltaproteobacteria bacterium]|nr:SDR family oxidoreductase [Deltaproteobacteria bacterium]